MKYLVVPLIYSLFMFCLLIIHLFAVRIITTKRLNINQKEFDEFTKGMSIKEKRECLIDFCENNKIKHNWKFYYIPRIKESE